MQVVNHNHIAKMNICVTLSPYTPPMALAQPPAPQPPRKEALKMTSLLHRILALATAISLTGCATSQKIDPLPEKLASIKTIAVRHVPEPAPVLESARTVTGGMGLFGLAGALLAYVEANNRPGWSAELAEQLQQLVTENSDVPLSDVLEQGIVAQLQSRGFESRTTKTPAETDADATLVVSYVFYGFINDQVEKATAFDPTKLTNIPRERDYVNNYHPVLWIGVDLLGKDGNEILYRGFHASGWKPPEDAKVIPNWYPFYDDWTHTPTAAPITFENVGEVAADPQKFIAEFREMAQAIAASVAEDIKR